MDSKDVQGYLANTVRGKDNGRQKLTFDPATGKLRVVEEVDNPDSQVTVDMARDGFFTVLNDHVLNDHGNN